MAERPEREAGKATPAGDQEAGLAMPVGRQGDDGVESVSASMEGAGETLEQEAGSWADEARYQGRLLLNEQKEQMAEQISGVAQALRQSVEHYQQQNEQQAAGRVLEQTATGLDQLSDLLRSGDVDLLLRRTGNLMRQQPALFMGGAVAAGFVLSRFLKSSTEHGHGLHQTYPDAPDTASQKAFDGKRPDGAATTSSELGE